MNRILLLSLIVGALSIVGYVTAPSAADEREDERGSKKGGPSIERIMKTVHGKRGLMKTLGTQLKAEKIDWIAVQASTKEILPLATALGKRKPDKGSKESWAELTDIYADNAKELAAAAVKKDAVATKEFFEELNTSCQKCHTRHKGD